MDNKVLSTILSVVGLYLGNWIARSIFYSFLDGSTKMSFITKGEWIIAGVICGIICFINSINKETVSTIVSIAVIGGTCIAMWIPFSIGLVVLYNIILVGSITYSVWGKD